MRQILEKEKFKKKKKRYLREGTENLPYTPLIRQIARDIFRSERPELTDVVHIQPQMRKQGIIKGLSNRLFKGLSARPDDCDVLIFFFVGGITFSEIKEVLDVLSETKDPNRNLPSKILFGSTCISSPSHIFHKVVLADD